MSLLCLKLYYLNTILYYKEPGLFGKMVFFRLKKREFKMSLGIFFLDTEMLKNYDIMMTGLRSQFLKDLTGHIRDNLHIKISN